MLHYSRNHSGTGCGSENAKHYLCGIDSSGVVLRMAYKGQGLVYPYALLYWRLCTGIACSSGCDCVQIWSTGLSGDDSVLIWYDRYSYGL